MSQPSPHRPPADRLVQLDPASLAALIRSDQRARWDRGERVPVEDYLRRFPELAGTPAALELVRGEWQLRKASGAAQALGEFQNRFPELASALAEYAELEDAFAGGLLEAVPAAHPTSIASSPSAALHTADLALRTPPLPVTVVSTGRSAERPDGWADQRSRARYTVIRVLGEGGLGQVFVAVDHDLNREVALKRIRPAHADGAGDQQRFVREAQVTGQLEHPNIVPVYESGRDPGDGRPFYTMRLARGRTLGEAVAEHHARRREGKEDPLDRPRLLTTFVGVCQAVGYAHSRGVLHRDLKPANVVLGSFGEVMVLDWGLAKMIDRPDDFDGAVVSLSDQARESSTLVGSIVGTPAYMAPEQGQNQQVDERSDVYGLGAILYEILTGRPPRTVRTIAEVPAALALDPPAARAVEPAVPPALDAACMKALARDPAARYQRATDLADDVQRFLADEPVSAWREPLAVRARRWVGRHRTLVTSTAVAVAVLAASLGVATGLLTAANGREQAARQLAQEREAEANRERDRAASNFGLARRAVDRYLDRVSDSEELKAHGLERLRKQLLETATEFLRELAAGEGNDTAVRADRGRALWRLGALTSDIGSRDEAAALLRRARDVQDQLAREFPGDPTHREDRARTDNQLGNLHADAGDYRAAEEHYDRALADRRELAEAAPGQPDRWSALAGTHQNLANTYKATGRWDRAESAYTESVRTYERLVGVDPGSALHRRGLGTALNNLGTFRVQTAAPDEAERTHRRAVEVWLDVNKTFGDTPENRRGLADAYLSLGVTLTAVERPRDAEGAYRAAIGHLENLAANHPAVGEHRHALASAFNNLGLLLVRTRPADAEAAYRKSLELRERLVKEFAGVVQYRRGLAVTLTNLGTFRSGHGRQADAEDSLRRAGELFESLARENPASPECKTDLAGYHNNFAVAGGAGPVKAAEHAREALRLRRELARAFPTVPDHAAGEARCHDNLAALHLEGGQLTAAEEEVRLAAATWNRLITEYPTVIGYRHELAAGHYNRGLILRPRKSGEAAKSFARAAEVWDRLTADRPAVPRFRSGAAKAHYWSGRLLMDGFKLVPAEERFRAAVAHGESLVRAHPDVNEFAADLGRSYYSLGFVRAFAPSGRTESLTWYERAVGTLERAWQADRSNEGLQSDLFLAYFGHASAFDLLKQPDRSVPLWLRALERSNARNRGTVRTFLFLALENLFQQRLRELGREIGGGLW